MIYRLTLKHDHGLTKITLYGHNSEESAIQSIMATERCPRRAILSVEDLTPVPRTTQEQTRLS